MDGIDPAEVAKKYNSTPVIWDEKDQWHLRQREMIDDFIRESLKSIPIDPAFKILNAGSAGYSYGLDEKIILHVDIAEARISHLQNSLVANIQNLPLPPDQFDMAICVGSVINYCDPVAVISEFARVLKHSGCLILEFENSHTLELLGKRTFNKKAVLQNTFYNGNVEKVWYFSEDYIMELAHLSGFSCVAVKRVHIISPLVYRLFRSESLAAKFVILDKLCSRIPWLRKFSSNSIVLFHNSKC
ncbi:MAG TPA: class I SAM-dependent methyltransferase [Cytophagaceae bacterium]|jgi:SAM-dependent methyltransferase|nr:class I SAM-dependent methyltransferase [Cytophagaceae bacterium]